MATEKRGRKPKYQKAMTPTEKAREYRARKTAHGGKIIYFAMSGKTVELIDDMVEFFELKGRAEAVTALLRRPLSEASPIIKQAKREIQIPENATKDDLKAVKLAKDIIWKAIID